MSDDTLPLHNEQAEWMLIACATDMPAIIQSLDLDLFYLTETRTVFEALTAVHTEGRQVCQHSVGMKLQGELLGKFCTTLKDLPSPAGWSYWLEVCQEFREARESLRIAAEISSEAGTVQTGGRIAIGAHVQKLQAIGKNSAGTKSQQLREILPAVLDRLEVAFTDPESLYGSRTGFTSLDEITLGFQPGQLWVIGARPSVGKSAIAATIANHVSAAGVPVGFFSLEMPANEIGARFLAIESGVELNKARNRGLTERDFSEWSRANARLVKRPLHIIDDLRDTEDVCRIASKLVLESGVKLVVIDYLQLMTMRASTEGRYTTVGLISNTLKSFALFNKISVLALAQLSRAVEKEDRSPNLSDLRDSGCIEQDADVICLLHRQATPTKETVQIPVHLHLAKNRNGEVGIVPMIFQNRITRYEEAP